MRSDLIEISENNFQYAEKLEIHELAMLMPPMTEEEFENLKKDIEENGLQNPVVLFEDKILDGRNRYRACKELGIEPATKEYKGSSPAFFVFSQNVKRRHLTKSQLATVAVIFMPELEKEAKERQRLSGGDRKSDSANLREPIADSGKASEKAAKLTGASPRYVEEAKKLQDENPELFEQVNSGKKTIHEAVKEIKRDERQKKRSDLIIPENINIDIQCGDFRKLMKNLPDNSVSLILTDPPYPKEYLPLWKDLSREAKRVLKPGGFLISYSGQAYLPKVINSLSENLEYYWLGMLYHKGRAGQRFEVNMFNRAKPILFFYKPPLTKQEKWIDDVIISERPDKDFHEWGQSVNPCEKIIEAFSQPGEMVLDPMFGGGSVIEASVNNKRNVIGFEINQESFDLVQERIKKGGEKA